MNLLCNIIINKLLPLILFFGSYGALANDVSPGDYFKEATIDNTNNEVLKVFIFERTGCDNCEQLNVRINELLKRYDDKLECIYFSLDDSNKKALLNAFIHTYNGYYIDQVSTPIVFFGDSMFWGEDAVKNVPDAMLQLLNGNSIPVTRYPDLYDIKNAEIEMVNAFSSVSFIAVMIAGFVDGINPCIFTGLVFFVGLLSVAHFSRKVLIKIGICYCGSCFITYLLIGSGLLGAINFLWRFQFIISYIYFIMGMLMVLLSLLSLYDAISYYKLKDSNRIVLQLPEKIKALIRKVMKTGVKSYYLLPGIFFVGVVVTLLESACTAQLYLPTMVMLYDHSGLSFHTFLLLLLYNLMCIMPLVGVFCALLLGINSFSFVKFNKKQIVYSKLFLSLLFFVFAGIFLINT